MTFLLIIPVWILLMALIVGLCAAARVGDKELRNEIALAHASSWGDRGSQTGVAVVGRPGARTSVSRKVGSAHERTGVGVAA